MAVPKGGVCGSLDVVEQLDVGAVAPESWRALSLCRADDEFALDANRWRLFGAAPRRVDSSSTFERPTSTPLIAVMASSFPTVINGHLV
jgi:hypothetical protein